MHRIRVTVDGRRPRAGWLGVPVFFTRCVIAGRISQILHISCTIQG